MEIWRFDPQKQDFVLERVVKSWAQELQEKTDKALKDLKQLP